jgi:hypothetical protein
MGEPSAEATAAYVQILSISSFGAIQYTSLKSAVK